ncbi:unnamed protein product, partial [Meganyctiphanes norvegica]
YGNNDKGTCKLRHQDCTNEVRITHTTFNSRPVARTYPVLTTVEFKTKATIFSKWDTTFTHQVCTTQAQYINKVEFVEEPFLHTIHSCNPVASEWTLTKFVPLTTVVTLNECDSSDMTLTVQKVNSFVTHVPTTLVTLETRKHTMTKFIPIPVSTEHTVCTKGPVCDKGGNGGGYGRNGGGHGGHGGGHGGNGGGYGGNGGGYGGNGGGHGGNGGGHGGNGGGYGQPPTPHYPPPPPIYGSG